MKYIKPLLAACMAASTMSSAAPIPLNNERIQSTVFKRQGGESNTNNVGLQSLLQRSDAEASVIDKRGFWSSVFGSGSKEAEKLAEKGAENAGKEENKGWFSKPSHKWLTAGGVVVSAWVLWRLSHNGQPPPPGYGYGGNYGGGYGAGGGGGYAGGGMPVMGGGGGMYGPLPYNAGGDGGMYGPPPYSTGGGGGYYTGGGGGYGTGGGSVNMSKRSPDEDLLHRETQASGKVEEKVQEEGKTVSS